MEKIFFYRSYYNVYWIPFFKYYTIGSSIESTHVFALINHLVVIVLRKIIYIYIYILFKKKNNGLSLQNRRNMKKVISMINFFCNCYLSMQGRVRLLNPWTKHDSTNSHINTTILMPT